MGERKMKVLSIGAHPDDADTSAGGLLVKLRDKAGSINLDQEPGGAGGGGGGGGGGVP